VRYNLGCSLSYEIGPDVTLIFNLEVARITGQKLPKESLVLSPPLERSVYTDPAVTGGVDPRIDGEACAGEDKGRLRPLDCLTA
jgi:hypothetical protein